MPRSLRELRTKVRKQQEPWASRIFYRRISLLITFALWRTRIPPHAVSWCAAMFGLAGAGLLAMPGGPLWWRLAGVLGLQLAFLGDHVDGELARARGTHSIGGIFIDEAALEVAVPIAIAFAVPFAVYNDVSSRFWLLAGVGFAFLRVLNLGVYFLTALFRARHEHDRPQTAVRRETWNPLREIAKWYWVISKVIGAVSMLVVADVVLRYRGVQLHVGSRPVTLLGAYELLGLLVLGLSTLLAAIHGTRGRFSS